MNIKLYFQVLPGRWTVRTFHCDKCSYVAKRVTNLKTHIESQHIGIRFKCNQCEYKATGMGYLKIHKESKHEGVLIHLINVHMFHPFWVVWTDTKKVDILEHCFTVMNANIQHLEKATCRNTRKKNMGRDVHAIFAIMLQQEPII